MRTPLFIVALLFVAGASILAGQPPATQSDFANATRGMDRRGIAEYVFRTYECQTCHVATSNGATGFTARGVDAQRRFVGCVRLLTTVAASAASASTPTADQRQAAETFKEFGCVFCHQNADGAMGYTDVGRTLGSLHMGCVEVRNEVIKGGDR